MQTTMTSRRGTGIAGLRRRPAAKVTAAGLVAMASVAQAQLPPLGPAAPASSVIPAGMAMIADSALGGERSGASFFTFPAAGSGEAIFFVVEEVEINASSRITRLVVHTPEPR